MSVTIVAAPVSLGYVLVTALLGGVTAASTAVAMQNNKQPTYTNAIQSLDSISINKEDIEQICKEYKTVIADKNLLMKTLQEHGVDKLLIKDEAIYATISEFNLLFTRENEEAVYDLKIFMSCDSDAQTLVNELFGEYCINTQEATYEKIKERLEQRNLQIDEEEILEDNSIMLTVNLN